MESQPFGAAYGTYPSLWTKEDVLVFNMVADNTREGQVLSKLLTKLDVIRESMGDDRVYDVIQDVLKDVSLEAIISSVFDGKESDLDLFLNQNNQQLESEFKNRIEEQQNAIAHSEVDYKDARILKEDSDEKRLQLSTSNCSLNGHSAI